MTAWVLIIMTLHTSQQIAMPSKTTCDRAKQVFIESGGMDTDFYHVVCIPQKE